MTSTTPTAVSGPAESLQDMQTHWEATQLPLLEALSCKFWRQSRSCGQIAAWQGDAEHWRSQVAKLVHEVALTHHGHARMPVRAIKKGARSIEQMVFNLQEVLFKLRVADELQEPPKPSRKRQVPARLVMCPVLAGVKPGF